MITLGKEIVSNILHTQDASPYLKRGMDLKWLVKDNQGAPEVFGTNRDDWHKGYRIILEHQEREGKVPTIGVFLETYAKRYSVKILPDDLSYESNTASELIDLAMERVKLAVADELAGEVYAAQQTGDLASLSRALTDSVAILADGIHDSSVLLSTTVGEDSDLVRLAKVEIPRGIPFGIPVIDREHNGIQPSWLVTFVGRQKATKTWIMLLMAYAAWQAGYDVLFYSVELSADEALQRLASLALHLDPNKWTVPADQRRPGVNWFDEEELDELGKLDQKFRERENKLTVKQLDWGTTTQTITADVVRFGSAVVFFDGIYELSDKEGHSSGTDWHAQDQVARELKQLGLRLNISVVVTTQAQEKQLDKKRVPGIPLFAVQAGSAWNRYSDLLISLDYESPETNHRIYVTNMLHRRQPIPEAVITWDFSRASFRTDEYHRMTDVLTQRFTEQIEEGSPIRTRTVVRNAG